MSSGGTARWVLAIEVSQREGGVALARIDAGELRITEIAVGAPDPMRDRLMPAIDAAFRTAGAEPRALAAVIVSIGPGGFTGLRMAVATAKALALATGCAVVTVPSAVVAARAAIDTVARGAGESMLIVLASKGEDAWVSHVRWTNGSCTEVAAALVDASGFEATIREARLRSGDDTPSGRGEASSCVPASAPRLLCDEHLPASFAVVADAHGLPRLTLGPSARACLLEGLSRHAMGLSEDPDRVAPLYPREPEAVRLWRQRHSPVTAHPAQAEQPAKALDRSTGAP